MEPTFSIFPFLKELGEFEYELSVLDFVWNILFPDRRITPFINWKPLPILKPRTEISF